MNHKQRHHWGRDASLDERGATEILGLIMLFGLVAVVGGGVLIAASVTMDQSEDRLNLAAAEGSVHKLDAEFGSVSVGHGTAAHLSIPTQRPLVGETDLAENNVVVTLNADPRCSTGPLPLPAFGYENEAGDAVVYQGGGVWRFTDSGVVQVSRPDLEYANYGIRLPLVNVTGETVLSGDVSVQRDDDASRVSSRAATTALVGGSVCDEGAPDNVTISVTSTYVDLWETYLRDSFPGDVTKTGNTVAVVVSKEWLTAPGDAVYRGDTIVIDGGEISSTRQYSANLTLLGTAIQAGGNDVPVFVWLNVDESRVNPWPGELNVGVGQEYDPYELSRQPAGTAISVGARAQGYYSADSQDRADQQVKLLVDGDPVPNIEGHEGQDDVKAFLTDYIDDGKISLEPDEVIFLFELGTEDLDSSAADFQDAVVLFQLTEVVETVTVDGSHVSWGYIAYGSNPPITVSVTEVTLG
ncbi:DUF7289 family protein [Haloarchaeobius sp. DFWS5]|uniref:DUF7289 family protein n=1 Tax=Haloarchaeobius sp. DFWS5 TaxID=3446114 RepID=UPI003EBFA65B